jgi:general secretion pathway protein A
MYNDFYGFSATPFHILPNLDFLFMSPKHQQALACMEFGLMRDIGLMLITGEIGIGKTTLVRHFLHHAEKDILVACIFNTNVTPDQLLALILQEFGVDIQTDSKAVTVQALQRFLQNMHAKNSRPFLIIDDAQNLSNEALEEVRLLSNLQQGNKALVQIMLVGQPELKSKISKPAMASFAQRIGVSYHLLPLTCPETHEYVTHRLKTVGGRPGLFTPAAVDVIHEAASGIPRAINLLCDNALVYGYVDELQTIEVQTVKQVIDELGVYFVGFDPEATQQAEAAAIQPSGPSPAGNNGAAAHGPEHLETRLASLERLVNGYIKEMHGVLKSQLHNERNRADKLLMEYTRLKFKFDVLRNPNGAPDDHSGEPSRKSDGAKKKAPKPPGIVSRLAKIQKK